MKVGQKVYFLRERPPRIYDYSHPEEAIINKIGKTILYVQVLRTGVVHRFKIKTLDDASYTYHKLYLTENELMVAQRIDKEQNNSAATMEIISDAYITTHEVNI